MTHNDADDLRQEPAARGFPPEQLEPPSPPARRILGLLWLVLFLGSILVLAGSTWRYYVFHTVTQPSFASLGLVPRNVETDQWRLSPVGAPKKSGGKPRCVGLPQLSPEASRAAATKGLTGCESAAWIAGVRSRSRVTAINGRPVPESWSAGQVAGMLEGPDGESVSLTLARPSAKKANKEPQEFRLARSATERDRVYAQEDRTFRQASVIIGLLASLLILGVAASLRLRKFDEAVPILVSFALIPLAIRGSWRFWDWIGVDWIYPLSNILGMGLLIAVIPALPTGRYMPRWSRWFLLIGPLVAAFYYSNDFWRSLDADHRDIVPDAVLWWVPGLVFAVLLAVFAWRFVRTRPSAERQQLKWLALAIGLGVAFYAVGELLEQFALTNSDDASAPTPRTIAYALSRAAVVVGLLAALFAYRLNQADEAIGRSIGYAAITGLVAIVYAGSEPLIDEAVKAMLKSNDVGQEKAVGAAVSAALAIAIFAPARSRLLTWAETRYRSGVSQLRSLPARLAQWHNEEDPDLVAARAVSAIARSLDARGAALVRDLEGEGEIVALHGVGAERVKEYLAAPKANKSLDPFPLRIAVPEPTGPGLTLLVGRRSDGASYDRDERTAVTSVSEPLADLLRCVAGKAERNRSLTALLAEMNERLKRLDSAGADEGAGAVGLATPCR
jgi:hypothetical protein